MKIKEFNKLVRDRIPYVIEQSGKKPVTKMLDDKEYIDCLIDKRIEEVIELMEAIENKKISNIIEELADVKLVEETIKEFFPKRHDPKVLHNCEKLRKQYNITHTKLARTTSKKNKDKGMFLRRIYLIRTEEKD